MPHPDPLQLQSYLDDELPDPIRQSIRSHIVQCPSCHESLQESRRLGLALKAALPPERMFLSDGKFWSRLAAKLSADRPPTWPLIPYLPPLLLATVGTLVQVLVFATRVAYELTGLGVIPSPSPMVSEGLSSLLLPGEWQQWLQARVGWPGKDVAQSTVHYWENLNSGTQDAVIFATVLLTLGVFMTVVVAFYSSWAICWTKPARPDRQKEVSDHGIRSYH